MQDLDAIWDRFLVYGKGLFYIRPTEKSYRLYWFNKDSYRTYYSPEGELEEVISYLSLQGEDHPKVLLVLD